MRATPGREPHVPYQIPKFPFKIWNMLTVEGQYFICPFNVGNIMYKLLILAFMGLFLPEKRVSQYMG